MESGLKVHIPLSSTVFVLPLNVPFDLEIWGEEGKKRFSCGSKIASCETRPTREAARCVEMGRKRVLKKFIRP